jgi:hypothetical protein
MNPRSGWIVPVIVVRCWLSAGIAAEAQPRIGVVESKTAAAWLKSAGLEPLEVTGEQFAAAVPDVPVIILPLDRVRSESMLRAISPYIARGGKLVAVYWGTIARPEQQSAYPVYGAASLLGVRIAGWSLIGPVGVSPEINLLGGGTASREAIPPSTSVSHPLTLARLDRLSQVMVVRVDPGPLVQVLARLVPAAGAYPVPLAVRNGNVYYVAANLFQPGANEAEMRSLFFWILDQASPGIMVSGVRERAGTAAAAVIQARERLAGQSTPSAAAVLHLLDEADAAAARAKRLAAGNDIPGSIAASDQARSLAERALAILEGH